MLAEWKPVWDQAVIVFTGEPIEWRVGVTLAAALLALMALEGTALNLRALSGRARKTDGDPPAPSRADSETPERSAPTQEPERADIASGPTLRTAPLSAGTHLRKAQHNRKRQTAAPRPQRPVRPQIRRRAAAQPSHE